jgi:hypothetical protein
MPHWLLQLIEFSLIGCSIAGGIILVHALLLFDFSRNAEGYLFLAARRLKSFLVTVLLVEWLIGAFLFAISFSFLWAYLPMRMLLAVMVGMLTASFPYALERAFLPKKAPSLKLQRFLIKLVFRLNLAVRYEFARAIAICREHDVFDCQSKGWDLGISPKELGRRLRILYELKKVEIAMERGDASLLCFDEGRNPWEKFYLLVRHIGRDELRRRLMNELPSPCDGWDGRERRQMPGPGSTSDRKNQNPNSHRIRCYDHPELAERIRKRKGWFLPVRKEP